MMRKIIAFIFLLIVVASFMFGCANLANIANDGKTKCPQCGTVFTYQEEDPDDASNKF